MSTIASRYRLIRIPAQFGRDVPFGQVGALGVCLLAFGAALLNLVALDPEKEIVGLDHQVLSKLVLTGLCGLYGMLAALTDRRVRRALSTFPLAWMVIIAGIYTAASVTSITPAESFASSTALWCIVLFTAAAVVQVGLRTVLWAILAGMFAYIAGSWIAFLLWPEFGAFAEPLSGGEFAQRMAGLSHPNTLGQFSALTIAILVTLVSSYHLPVRWVLAPIVMAAGALVLSISRASSAALLVSLAAVHRDWIWQRQRATLILLLLAIGVGVLVTVSTRTDLVQVFQAQLNALTKSGYTDELWTLTGRDEIWAHSAQLIVQRPVLGYGPATSKVLLQDYAGFTHNLWLNTALSAGVVCLLMTLLMCAGRIWQAMARPHRMADVIVLLIMFNGLLENVMFSFIPGAPTMLWIIALMWRFREAQDDLLEGGSG